MARRSHSLGVSLTKAETIAGWCYLPFYLVLLSVLLQYLFQLLGLTVTPIVLNTIYFAVNLAAVLLIFHRFLRQRFFGPGFWNYLQACILGFVFYYAGNWALSALIQVLGGELIIYNNDTVEALIVENQYVMLFVSIILAPIIEETLMRGLVFGSLRKTSRWLAYAASILIFTLMHNWQYFGSHDLGSVLLSCVCYLPASAALCWTYEKAQTIWAPITIHAIINAISYGVLTLS